MRAAVHTKGILSEERALDGLLLRRVRIRLRSVRWNNELDRKVERRPFTFTASACNGTTMKFNELARDDEA